MVRRRAGLLQAETQVNPETSASHRSGGTVRRGALSGVRATGCVAAPTGATPEPAARLPAAADRLEPAWFWPPAGRALPK